MEKVDQLLMTTYQEIRRQVENLTADEQLRLLAISRPRLPRSFGTPNQWRDIRRGNNDDIE